MTEPSRQEVERGRLAALHRGDREELGRTLRELLPDVRRWLTRYLGPGAQLDDATQDVLIELTSALRRHEGRSSFRTLAFRVTARHASRAVARRRKRAETSLSLVPPPATELDPESRAIDREALLRLYRCLDRLPEKPRTAFVLCAIEGMSASEAGELAGASSVTMRSRLFAARREIDRRLAGDPYIGRLLRTSEKGVA